MEQRHEITKRHEIIKGIIEKELTYAAHDYDHVLRVLHLSKTLAESETEVDMDILIPAVMLHDIAREVEDTDVSGEIDHAMLGAEMAEDILQKLSYQQEEIQQIKHCIQSHRFRSGSVPASIEAQILFDADKVDVIGAIGIARSYMLAGQHGERLFHNIPIEQYVKDNVGQNGRIKDLSQHTAYFEFELKLRKIPERLYTPKAREIAQARIAYMEEFFGKLKDEIYLR